MLDPDDYDGFIAELLGEHAAAAAVQPRRRLLVSARAGARRLASPAARRPSRAPLAGSGNVGTPVIAATIPIGRAFGPVTVHEVGAASHAWSGRRRRRREHEADHARARHVVQRADRPGLLPARPARARSSPLDSSKPPEQRNLRLRRPARRSEVPARNRGARRDRAWSPAAARSCTTRIRASTSARSTSHSAAALTMQAICLVATRSTPTARKGFSLRRDPHLRARQSVSARHGLLPPGLRRDVRPAPHLRRGRDARGAADRPAAQRALPDRSGAPHRPRSCARCRRSSRPRQRQPHRSACSSRSGGRRRRSSQFELGVLYEWGNQHRLIMLGRVSAILPRADLAILKLNMDAVGILDFDAGTFALDAVLYDSKLCGRFVITGAMAMRMGWQGIGRLRPGRRRPAPQVRRAGGLPQRGAAAARAHQRRQPEADLPGLLRDHLEHRAVRRRRSLYAAAYGFSIDRRRRLRRADPAAAVPLPRRVPRQRAAQARQPQPVQGLGRRRARGAAAAAGCRARRRSRSSGATSRCRSTRPWSTAARRTTCVPSTSSACCFSALSDPNAWQAQLPSGRQRSSVVVRQPRDRRRPAASARHADGAADRRAAQSDARHRPRRHRHAERRPTLHHHRRRDRRRSLQPTTGVQELFAPGAVLRHDATTTSSPRRRSRRWTRA